MNQVTATSLLVPIQVFTHPMPQSCPTAEASKCSPASQLAAVFGYRDAPQQRGRRASEALCRSPPSKEPLSRPQPPMRAPVQRPLPTALFFMLR